MRAPPPPGSAEPEFSLGAWSWERQHHDDAPRRMWRPRASPSPAPTQVGASFHSALSQHHAMTTGRRHCAMKGASRSGSRPRGLMSTHFYSCRHLLGLQVQRFVEQQQVSLKWISQGLSNSGRLEVKAIPLKQPCNYDTESLLCPQHTQYTCRMYRCTSSAKR
jgi:hypothetical protein